MSQVSAEEQAADAVEQENNQASDFLNALGAQAINDSEGGQPKSLLDLIDLEKLQEVFDNSDPEAMQMLWALLQDDDAQFSFEVPASEGAQADANAESVENGEDSEKEL